MKKDKKDDKIVNSIDNFEDTIIWMSARHWLASNPENELEPDYPTKMVERYWGGFSEYQRERLVVDVEREMSCGWRCSKRSGELLKVYNNTQPGTFTPYPKCDDFEFTLIRMAILYACGRRTIASSTLPSEIIQNRYKYMTPSHKKIIVEDLTRYLNNLEKFNMEKIFGDKNIDDRSWQKFMAALDVSRHYTVKIDPTYCDSAKEIICFKCKVINRYWNEEKNINEFVEEEVVYPLESYLESSSREIFIPKTCINDN